MRASESSGNAVESLQVRSGGPSRSNWIEPVPNSGSSPGRLLLASQCGLPEPNPPLPALLAAGSSFPGREAPAPESPSGQKEPILSAQPNTLPGPRTNPPPTPLHQPHLCPRGRSPPARSLASLQRTRHPVLPRARPPLTLRRSRPSPQRPPGLRSSAAGVGVGGAGRAGPGGVPASWPHKAEATSQRPIQRSAAPPPRPLPARSLKAERRARLPGRLAERHRK